MSEARVPWNKSTIDEDFIRANYYKMSAREIGEALGVSRELINHRARKLGLRKSKVPFVALEGEELKQILEAPNYAISNLGRVVNLENMTLLRPKLDRTGYVKVVMYAGDKRVERRVHRLLAEAFIDNPDNLPFVNHIDGDKTNYAIENLEWVTPKENSQHASETGLLRKGEDSPHAKITETQARMILDDSKQGLTPSQLLEKHPYATKSIVTKIADRTRWKHLDRGIS